MKNKLAALGVSLLVVAAIVVTFLLRDQDRRAVPSSANLFACSPGVAKRRE